MMQITLNTEQEQFLKKQLDTGKYNNPEEVITQAFRLLEQEDDTDLPTHIKGSESAKILLKEKLKNYRKEREQNKDNYLETERGKLSQELRDLFDKTQAIPVIQDITEEEIAAEIEAYRIGE